VWGNLSANRTIPIGLCPVVYGRIQQPNGKDREEPGVSGADEADPNAAALKLKEFAIWEHDEAEPLGTGTTRGGLSPAVLVSVAPSGITAPPSDVTAADPGAVGGAQPGDCAGSTAVPVVPMTSIAELKLAGRLIPLTQVCLDVVC
jgi:hypothetical protein